jgi:6-phosphofructokinase 2
MNAPILTVTLNPAVDVTTSVKALLPQQKLRCAAPHYLPGGGGINVSRAILELGGESQAFVVLGGGTGTHYEQLLREKGLSAEIWPMPEETRISLSVLDESSGQHFRFVLPGPAMAPLEGDRIVARLSQLMAHGFRYLVASGSLPPGLPADTYGRLTDIARAHGARVVLDTQGEALKAALPHKPHILRLADYEAEGLASSAGGRAPGDLAGDLLAITGAEVVIITLGARGALVRTAAGGFEIRPPRVAVRSAIGAGDSFVGALTLGLARDWPLEDAVRYGVAAAASAVTTLSNQLCEREAVERYFAEIGGPRAAKPD